MKIPYTYCSIGSCGGAVTDYIQAHLKYDKRPFSVSYSVVCRIDPVTIDGVKYYFRIFRNWSRKVAICIPDSTISKTTIIKVADDDWNVEPFGS